MQEKIYQIKWHQTTNDVDPIEMFLPEKIKNKLESNNSRFQIVFFSGHRCLGK